jgi:uncharacterized SAM-binding protein YcdF (DUF218 family)
MNQFFAPLAEPVGALWCLMFLGELWLLCRRQWRSAMWLGFPTVLLFVIGSTSVAERLVAAEEKQYAGGAGRRDCGPTGQQDKGKLLVSHLSSAANPQLSILNSSATQSGTEAAQSPNAPVDAVVALGGGQRVSRHDSLGFAMGDGGSRVLTAIELVRSGKARTLVLGGSWPFPGRGDVPSMCVVQDWVTSWGLTGGAVTNLGICINTHDEAVAFRKLAQGQGWLNVMLVTSALHMRRSVALFKKQGIEVTPVAADFQVQGVSQDLPFSPFPRQHRLFLMTLYMHEKIGWWLYRARGWI